jgi:transglutaminase-like putative cysteine protease
MKYSITHTTNYQYHEKVNLCHNLVILKPRNSDTQTCHSFHIAISPLPEVFDEYEDFFGNKVCYFELEQEHEALRVTANSVVEKLNPSHPLISTDQQPWENVRDLLASSVGTYFEAKQFCNPTEITKSAPAIKEYAAISFTKDRHIFDAVKDLMQRIYHDFKYTPGFSTISTPLSSVLKERKGVCQDFAHLGIACLRSMGLAARYVSGYIETIPPKGKEKLLGTDASHAWFSVFIPAMGWVDFDPTNNQLPGEQHITIGWGRDYFDIVPLRGIIISGQPHELRVSVDVKRID